MIDFERTALLLEVVHKSAGTPAYNSIAALANAELVALNDEAKGALADMAADAKAKAEADAETAKIEAEAANKDDTNTDDSPKSSPKVIPASSPTIADRRV